MAKNKIDEFKKNKFMKKVFMDNQTSNAGWDNPILFESLLMYIIHSDKKDDELFTYMHTLMNDMSENHNQWSQTINESFDDITRNDFNLLLPFCDAYMTQAQSLLFLTVLKNIFDNTNIEICNVHAKKFIHKFMYAEKEDLDKIPNNTMSNIIDKLKIIIKILLTTFCDQGFITKTQINVYKDYMDKCMEEECEFNGVEHYDIFNKNPIQMFVMKFIGCEAKITMFPLADNEVEDFHVKIENSVLPAIKKLERIEDSSSKEKIKYTENYIKLFANSQIECREQIKNSYKPLKDKINQQIREKITKMSESHIQGFITPYDLSIYENSLTSSRQSSGAYTIRKNINSIFLGLLDLKSYEGIVDLMVDSWYNITIILLLKVLINENIKFIPTPDDLFQFIHGMIEYNISEDKKMKYEPKSIFKKMGKNNIKKIYESMNINYIDAVITDLVGRTIYEMTLADTRLQYNGLTNILGIAKIIDEFNDMSEKYEEINDELEEYKNADVKIGNIRKELKDSESKIHKLVREKKELQNENDKLREDIRILTLIDDNQSNDEVNEEDEKIEINENMIQKLSQDYKIAFISGHERTVNRLQEKIPNLYIAKGIETYRDVKDEHIKNCDFIFFSTSYSKHNAYFYIKKMTERYHKNIYYINVENVGRIVNTIFETINLEISKLASNEILQPAT